MGWLRKLVRRRSKPSEQDLHRKASPAEVERYREEALARGRINPPAIPPVLPFP